VLGGLITLSKSVLEAYNRSPTRARLGAIARRMGVKAYAVGGAVRDVAAGRKVHDWDIVCKDAMRLAAALARDLGGSFVWLHDSPATARVVVGVHGASVPREEIDFSDLRGGNLDEDLRARDFTINSLAWPVGQEPSPLIDPCGGLRDIATKTIRANGPAVLAADPLRCLRAYRLAAELDFSIDAVTAQWISLHAEGLQSVACERIGAEITRLVAPRGLHKRLAQMISSRVLGAILPELGELRGLMQGRYHHLDAWDHTLLVLSEIERIASDPQKTFRRSTPFVRDYLSRPEALLRLKLAGLLHDVGKPGTRAVIAGRIRFLGHADKGAQMAEDVLHRLRLPRSARNAVPGIISLHMRPLMLVNATEGSPPTLSAVRRLFRDSDPDGMALIVLSVADLLACRGPATDPERQADNLQTIDAMIAEYETWRSQREREPLLRGRDLIEELGLVPGPSFSVILETVERAQTDGEVTNRSQALALAERLVREGPCGPDRERP